MHYKKLCESGNCIVYVVSIQNTSLFCFFFGGGEMPLIASFKSGMKENQKQKLQFLSVLFDTTMSLHAYQPH